MSIDCFYGSKELNVKPETVLPGVWYKLSCKHQLFANSKNVQIDLLSGQTSVSQESKQQQNFLQKHESIANILNSHKKVSKYKIVCKIWVNSKAFQVSQKSKQVKIFLQKHESIAEFLKCPNQV